MTTEELKRRMYLNLHQAKTVYGQEAFEDCLEEYLEALRQELRLAHEALGELAFQLHESEKAREDMATVARLSGEELRRRVKKIRKLEELLSSQEEHNSQGATLARNSGENVSGEASAASKHDLNWIQRVKGGV